jgi:prepilin-type N-terminal cleavage/methylation domain-containing protein
MAAKRYRYKKGFTLIEVVVSLFVFALLMASVSGIFANTVAGYKAARSSQRDTENAQYAMNAMAKELRTSSIASSSATAVRFYDYSQDICFAYRIQNGNLEVASVAPSDPTALPLALDKLNFCLSASIGSYTIVTTGVVTGNFSIIASTSAPASVGKVTISLQIAEGTKHAARLQTTASLRDYSYTGI